MRNEKLFRYNGFFSLNVFECGTNTVQTKAKGRNKVKVSAYLKHLLELQHYIQPVYLFLSFLKWGLWFRLCLELTFSSKNVLYVFSLTVLVPRELKGDFLAGWFELIDLFMPGKAQTNTLVFDHIQPNAFLPHIIKGRNHTYSSSSPSSSPS